MEVAREYCGKRRYSPAIFDTLNEALFDLEAKRHRGVGAWLVDDRGYQIL